jgi:hypothetical protein
MHLKCLVLFTVLSVNLCFAQKTPTYYLTGRPLDIPRNNALRLIGQENGVRFEYAGADVYEAKGFEGLEKHNDSVFQYISKTSAFGSFWLDTLYLQVESRLSIHEKVRTIIREQETYKSKAVLLVEPILLISKDKNQQKFELQLIGQYINKPEQGFFCVSRLVVRLAPLKVRTKACSGRRHMVLPENGIDKITHE